MSVEHPTCPHCEEPLNRVIDNGVAGFGPCPNPQRPGKQPDAEDVKINHVRREAGGKN